MDRSPVCGCRHCGLLFLNPQPGLEVSQESARSSEPSTSIDVYEANAAERIQELTSYTGLTEGTLLLVGATAHLCAEARKAGFHIHAFSAREFESASKLDVPAGIQACILFCALEGMRDPLTVLQKLHDVLDIHGCLMVVSPMTDSKAARLLRASWWEFNRANLAPVLRNKTFRLSHGRTRSLVRSKARSFQPRFSVIVPVYNEAATFGELIEQLLNKKIDGLEIEGVLVESNSTDGSRDLVLRYKKHPLVMLILEDTPKGKGHAVRNGLKAATGDMVLFQDADLEYDIDDYDALVAPLPRFQNNFVLGSRHSISKNRWKIRQFSDSPGLVTLKDYKPVDLPVNYTSRALSEGKKVTVFRDPLTWIRALVKFRKTLLYRDRRSR